MATVAKRGVDPVLMQLAQRGFGLTTSTGRSAAKGRRQVPTHNDSIARGGYVAAELTPQASDDLTCGG
jgi:hypothetical protein